LTTLNIKERLHGIKKVEESTDFYLGSNLKSFITVKEKKKGLVKVGRSKG
jgi:hypothetical protein